VSLARKTHRGISAGRSLAQLYGPWAPQVARAAVTGGAALI